MKSYQKYGLFFLVFILVLIFYVSSLQFSGGVSSSLMSVGYHFGIFFLFGGFVFLLFIDRKISSREIFICLLFCFLYACLDELHQYFVPLRSATLSDVFVDSFGIVCSLIFVRFVSERKQKKGI